jgi:hypothetical protein
MLSGFIVIEEKGGLIVSHQLVTFKGHIVKKWPAPCPLKGFSRKLKMSLEISRILKIASKRNGFFSGWTFPFPFAGLFPFI